MNNTWNYKEDLQEPEAFEKIEKQYDIKIPEKLKDFVVEQPERVCVRLGRQRAPVWRGTIF